MEKKKASLALSSLAIILIVAFIAVGIGVFNVNIAILLFLCWMIIWPFAAHLGYSFSEMEGFAYEMAQKCIAPAAIVSVVIYLGIGIFISGDSYDASTVESIMNGLKGIFHINLIPVIPIVIVIVMILMKKGTIVSMLSGTVVAILIAVFYQGYSVADMGTFLYSGFTCDIENEILISLLNRGGMTNMLSLIAVFVGGLGLGGILDKTGMLEPIFHYITEKYKSPRGIMLMAWCATLLCILVIADNNFAFVMVATLFGSALVPWNVGAQFAAGVLGVSTLAYMPYAFLNWMTPILSLVFIIFQVKIKKGEE